MAGSLLPDLPSDTTDITAWVGTHLPGLFAGDLSASRRFRGGQQAADAALASFDVARYAATRNEVWPERRRGASGLSPYIRHGLLQLPVVWKAVEGGPARDVRKFRDELMWQEYSRHLYARMGERTRDGLRFAQKETSSSDRIWTDGMACTELVLEELVTDGWLVNQVRMWLASHWVVREGADWQSGEDWMYRQLLDGSRAANRLGWQWTGGLATGKPYGFSRWQVEKRAPGLCNTCSLRDRCPIQNWPDSDAVERVDPNPQLRRDPNPEHTAGPRETVRTASPDVVWLTAESLGDADPALAANPDLPAVFVFDEPLLRRLKLSAKRLVFLAETLADLATRRELEIHRGKPAAVLQGRRPAVTFAPVPGWRSRSARIEPAEIHPWPWLRRPGSGPVTSFTAWRKSLGR